MFVCAESCQDVQPFLVGQNELCRFLCFAGGRQVYIQPDDIAYKSAVSLVSLHKIWDQFNLIYCDCPPLSPKPSARSFSMADLAFSSFRAPKYTLAPHLASF